MGPKPCLGLIGSLAVLLLALQVGSCAASEQPGPAVARPTAASQTSQQMQAMETRQQQQQQHLLAATTSADGHLGANASLSQDLNQIDQDNLKFPLYMRLMATVVCLIIFSVGVCGNLLVPLVVIKTKYLKNSTNLFLINLSIADLLVLIVCMPTMLIELHSKPETWLLGENMCKLSNFVEMLAANGSIFTILAISFERYYAICKPLKAGYKCTRARAVAIICALWLLSLVLSSPVLAMAKSFEIRYIDGSLVHNCILETDSYWPKMYVFGSLLAFFCLPLLVLMLVYWLIARRLVREGVARLAGPAPAARPAAEWPAACRNFGRSRSLRSLARAPGGAAPAKRRLLAKACKALSLDHRPRLAAVVDAHEAARWACSQRLVRAAAGGQAAPALPLDAGPGPGRQLRAAGGPQAAALAPAATRADAPTRCWLAKLLEWARLRLCAGAGPAPPAAGALAAPRLGAPRGRRKRRPRAPESSSIGRANSCSLPLLDSQQLAGQRARRKSLEEPEDESSGFSSLGDRPAPADATDAPSPARPSDSSSGVGANAPDTRPSSAASSSLATGSQSARSPAELDQSGAATPESGRRCASAAASCQAKQAAGLQAHSRTLQRPAQQALAAVLELPASRTPCWRPDERLATLDARRPSRVNESKSVPVATGQPSERAAPRGGAFKPNKLQRTVSLADAHAEAPRLAPPTTTTTTTNEARQDPRTAPVGASWPASKRNLVSLAQVGLGETLKRVKQHRSGSQPMVSPSQEQRAGRPGLQWRQHSTASQLTTSDTHLQAARDLSKKQQMDSRRQVVIMLFFVVACFFLLFFPYRVFTIWLILSTEDQVRSLGMETYYNLTYFSRILIYLHSAINPIAYNLISTKFRRAFMSILLCRGPATRRHFTAEPHPFINNNNNNNNNNYNQHHQHNRLLNNTNHASASLLINGHCKINNQRTITCSTSSSASRLGGSSRGPLERQLTVHCA